MPFILSGNVGSATAATGYDVANSVRFDDGSNCQMRRAGVAGGNQDKFTLSMWIKRSNISTDHPRLFTSVAGGDDRFEVYFENTDELHIEGVDNGTATLNLVTSAKFRDVAAWMHILLAVDTGQGTEANRAKLYINGVLITAFGTSTRPDQNGNIGINTNSFPLQIGERSGYGVDFDGYLAEIVLLDGTQAANTDLGEFDEDSGIWKPIDPSGLTFGTNGFYLDFEASGNLGNDVNGGTDFSEANLAATDQTTDTCTNSFMTLNPLIGTGTYTDNQVYSEGNTIVIPNSTDNYGTAFGTFGATRGKWYWEAQIIWNGTSNNANYPKQIGFMREDYAFNKSYLGQNDDQTWGVAFHDLSTDGWGLDHNGSFGAITGATTLADDKMLMFALDLDNGKFYMGYDGTFFTSGDPTSGATGTGAIATLDATDLSFTIIPALTNATDSTHYKMNFGNPAYAIASSNADGDGFGNFEFAVPSGYFSWCTKNLAEYG